MSITFVLEEFSFTNGRFIALSPKSYYSYDEDTKKIKTGHKGVHHAEAKKFTLDTFVDCLYNDRAVEVTSRELRRNKQQQMIFNVTRKKGLNPIFKKFRVQEDKISCLPLCKQGKYLYFCVTLCNLDVDTI